MGKFVCLLVCLAVFVNTGYALKCYMCDSDKIDGCIKDSPNLKEQPCGNPAPGLQNVCSYAVFQDTQKKVDKVQASCEQIATSSPVAEASLKACVQPAAGLQKKECRVCNTDLCNSAPGFSTSLFGLLCLPVMYLFTKYVLY